jgi:hypothetical protein
MARFLLPSLRCAAIACLGTLGGLAAAWATNLHPLLG